MKLLKVFGLLLCGVLLTAATKGTEVTLDQINQFKTGSATILDIEGKLGMPQKTGPMDGGGTAADYILLQESANAASAIPIARLAAGAMNVHEMRVEFQFDASGHLASVQTSQRDMVCPHAACTATQLNQPWQAAPAQGD